MSIPLAWVFAVAALAIALLAQSVRNGRWASITPWALVIAGAMLAATPPIQGLRTWIVTTFQIDMSANGGFISLLLAIIVVLLVAEMQPPLVLREIIVLLVAGLVLASSYVGMLALDAIFNFAEEAIPPA